MPANKLNLLTAIRSKYVSVVKMIPFSDNLRDRLYQPLCINNMLSQGRTTRLAWRVQLTKKFFDFVISYNRHHGSAATVKWLKAALVALQKELGQDRMSSMLPLGTVLSHSRLTNGLPRLIPAKCRKLIRSGDKREIRFWTGLFNLYRIIQIPGNLKLDTITNPFSGNEEILSVYVDLGKSFNPFGLLPNFSKITSQSLMPTRFITSRAASPSSKVSATGILTDLYLLNHHQPSLLQELMYYLYEVHPKVSPFIKLLQDSISIIDRFKEYDGKELIGASGSTYLQNNHLSLKTSLRAHGFDPDSGQGLSQFAIKYEAAGKIRLFALVDSITQSVMSPLHDMLFNLLRVIPNDGTFDQDASIKRSQQKAIKAGKAYSFDLTAATDRLPAIVTANILSGITGKDIAESWLNIMTKRNFFFNSKIAEKLGVSPGPYQYAVGQPMGALSSWAGLAVTHHWIVQYASYLVTKTHKWNTNYEILGDDLVIFDTALAEQYLQIMSDLGCEINLHKSIVSHNRPVFEFAKRTCWGEDIVSGISMAQVRAAKTVAGRAANALSYIGSNLITSVPLLAITLARYAFTANRPSSFQILSKGSSERTMRLFALGILSLFGTAFQQGKLSLKVLMQVLVDPDNPEADFSGQAVGLPLRTSLNAIYSILTSEDGPDSHPVTSISLSNPDFREEVFEEYRTELATIMLQSAFKKAKVLLEQYDYLIEAFASSMISNVYNVATPEVPVPLADLPQDYRLLRIQLNSLAFEILGLDGTKYHPETWHDYIEDLCHRHARTLDQLVDFHQAQELLETTDSLMFKLSLPKVEKPGRTILESAPILSTLRNMDPNRNRKVSYLRTLEFKENPNIWGY